MIIHMRHTLWTGISETNVNITTSATRTHAFNNNNNNNNNNNKCIVFYTVNVTALCNASQWIQDRHASQTTIHSIFNNGPQPLNFRRANSKEAVRLSVYIWLNIINSLLR